MEGFKSVFASKTVWAGIVAIGGAVAALFGYNVAPEDAAGIVEAVGAVVAAVGGIAAIVSRISASKKIG